MLRDELWTISKARIEAPSVRLLGNKMSDKLFYTLTHTPLPLSHMDETGSKIIVCMSGHTFQVKEYYLSKSGLIARATSDSVFNVQSILDNNPEAVVLVSQKAKKFFDKETALQYYKSRIFCLLKRKEGIINKPVGSFKGVIKPVSVSY